MEANWIISLIVLVVAVCAALAALGFRGRITTVGIDLGTTFSVVGINKHGKIIIIEDKAGHKIFPSVVSYRDNGEIIVGYEAVAELSKHPKNTIYNAKRFIGRRLESWTLHNLAVTTFALRMLSLDEELVKIYAEEHPFKVVSSSLSNFSQVGFEVETLGATRIITPEQVGTEVLKFLLKLTADYLGHSQVNKAVIAVPAKFSAIQRQATGEAYKKAGLKVMRVIEEPTAAAVAYKLHKKSDIHHILVYDFGGGTLDVSLLYVAKGSVQVYATEGDETLGGSDFDLCLAKNIKTRIEEITGALILNDHSNWQHEPTKHEDHLCIFPSIHTKAEEIKKQLTYHQEVQFSCVLPNPERTEIEFGVSRMDLEGGCSNLFDRSLLPVHRLLTQLNMNKDDIDEIVLVGGSTRIPLIKQRLREYFQKELNDHIDPDITVAYGAASILD